MKLQEAYLKAKGYNENIIKTNAIPRIAYEVKKKNYNKYCVEAIPVLNLFTLNSIKLTSDFKSGFKRAFSKKYSSNGYKKWAKV